MKHGDHGQNFVAEKPKMYQLKYLAHQIYCANFTVALEHSARWAPKRN